MHDDREEFEQNQVDRDREGEQVEEDTAYLLERSRRFSEAMDRLDAEVAAHEGEATPAAGPLRELEVPEFPEMERFATEFHRRLGAVYRRLREGAGLSMGEVARRAGCSVTEVSALELGARPAPSTRATGKHEPDARDGAESEANGAPNGSGAGIAPDGSTYPIVFGDRLRVRLAEEPSFDCPALRGVADAIDRDAEQLRKAEAQALDLATARDPGRLRRLVEELVEELRHSITEVPIPDPRTVDVLDAEPFLARMPEIFGKRAEPVADIAISQDGRITTAPAALQEERDALSSALTEREGELRQALRDAARWKAAYDDVHLREMALQAHLVDLKGDIAEVSGLLEREHEPAHDRREREAARFEDHEGRVEGVDR